MERKWWTLLAVSVATVMLLLDITVVNVALPSIRKDLGATFTAWRGSRPNPRTCRLNRIPASLRVPRPSQILLVDVQGPPTSTGPTMYAEPAEPTCAAEAL